MIDKYGIRQSSLAKVEQLGLPINLDLPLIEDFSNPQSKDNIVSRSLCTYALLTVTYGFDINFCKQWLLQENLIDNLTNTEQFLLENNRDWKAYQTRVESLWELAWVMNLIDEVDYSKLCNNSLSSLFPKISKNQSTSSFRKYLEIRPYSEILSESDLTYCIHWGMMENALNNITNYVPLSVIEERRRALDWILYGYDWEDVPLDT